MFKRVRLIMLRPFSLTLAGVPRLKVLLGVLLGVRLGVRLGVLRTGVRPRKAAFLTGLGVAILAIGTGLILILLLLGS